MFKDRFKNLYASHINKTELVCLLVCWLFGWLVGWFYLCKLLNVKSILIQKQLYCKQFRLELVCSLNLKTFLFQAIQFNISTQFSSIWLIYRTLSGATISSQSGPWSDGQWTGTMHSPKLQHYWNLTIRLFCVISKTIVGGGSYPSAEKQSVYSIAPANWANIDEKFCCNNMLPLLKNWKNLN